MTFHRRGALGARKLSRVSGSLFKRSLAVVLTASFLVVLPVLSGGQSPASAAVQPHVYGGSGIYTYGDAHNYGSPVGSTLNSVVTAMAPTRDGHGYWLAAADGGVFTYGDAGFHGSAGAIGLYGPVVGMAPTPDDNGYWLVAIDGGVFSYGDAGFHGSMGGHPLNAPIVGMAATPDGRGYWLVAADGGIFSFGDAGFHGSMGGHPLNAPVVGMAATPDGRGYWLVAADGGIFTFGDAGFHGSLGSDTLPAGITGMASTPNGGGYWLSGWDGSVYQFGNAGFFGSNGGHVPPDPTVGIAATPDGNGYWLLMPDDINYSFSSPAPPYRIPGGASIAQTAESQVEGDPDIGQGAFCNPYGPCEPWCSLFATWVWEANGIPIPSYAFTGDIYYWAASNAAVLASWATPAPGDIILYGTGPQSVASSVHTGIVAQVWPDGAVITVEGDAGPAPNGMFSVIINGPFLPAQSEAYNGFPVYAFADP